MSIADYREILQRLDEAYQKNPTRPENLLNLAEAYEQAGVYSPDTKDIYSRAIQLQPRNTALLKAFSVVCLVKEGLAFLDRCADQDEYDREKAAEYLQSFERLSEKHPQSADVLLVLGHLLLLTGRGYDALTRYEQAQRLGGIRTRRIGSVFMTAMRHHVFSDDIMLHLSSLLEELGAYVEATRVTREVVMRSTTEEYVLNLFARQLEHALRLEANPDSRAELRIELCQVLHKLRRRADALQHLQQFSPGEVEDPTLVKQIARLLLQLKDFAGAFRHLENIALDDEAIALLNDIAIAQEGEGNIEAAVRMLQYVNLNHETFREHREAQERDLELTTELSIAELKIKANRFEEALERLVALYRAGYDEAEELLREIDRVLPRLPISAYPSLFELSKLCVARGNFNQAAVYASRVWQAWPNDEEVQRTMREIYNGLIERNPNIPEIRLKSAQLFHQVGQHEEAIKEYEFCAKFPEVKNAALHQLGICNLEAERFEAALEVYSRLRLEEEDFEPLYALYEIFSAETDVRKALKALNLIRKRNPQYRDIQSKIAALEEKLRKSEGKFIIDPKMKELIGDLAEVGRYRYIGKIGSGGMGVVHKVYDMKNSTIVAMKILREGLAGSGKAIDRFYREARIAAKLNHRNIVNIFDYSIGNVQGNSYITMEFVDGPSLRDLIERKFASTIDITTEDVAEALFYGSQICDALQATHELGIIHRDIKPDNVLINSDGVAKITDFGIVHVEEATFTPTGAMVGTPRYMSPEQVQGKRLDGRSDVYSAGIILYELLIGSPPFVTGDVSYQHVNVAPTPPIDICPILPEDVNALILKALEKSAENRFKDALAMRDALDACLARINDARTVTEESRAGSDGALKALDG